MFGWGTSSRPTSAVDGAVVAAGAASAGSRPGSAAGGHGGRSGGSRGSRPWDAGRFAADLSQAKTTGNKEALKKLLQEVAEHNYTCREFWTVPRTIPVSHADCMRRVKSLKYHSRQPVISISTMTTAEACQHFSKERGRKMCALNFANGETAGGGYKHGATAQEEDLCRQFPTLYSTLFNAHREGLYPFGPSTCKNPAQPAKYCDVLYTSNLTLARGGLEDGYPLLDERSQLQVSMVAAAAPNIRFAHEISDPELIYRGMVSIFVAPAIVEPEVNTLILGAWGCGAFGGDPKQIAELFVRALVSDNYGQLYQEVHFAIPKLATSDVNYEEFLKVFKEFNLRVQNLDRR